jgi:NADH-quinone oxidoreductase subunit E
VQDTLSFYGFFKQDAPVGRYRVWVCRSISCSACGSEPLLAYLCDRLGIRPGQTTADGRISLEFAECLGGCDGAPAMLVNDTLYKQLTQAKIEEFLAGIRS